MISVTFMMVLKDYNKSFKGPTNVRVIRRWNFNNVAPYLNL